VTVRNIFSILLFTRLQMNNEECCVEDKCTPAFVNALLHIFPQDHPNVTMLDIQFFVSLFNSIISSRYIASSNAYLYNRSHLYTIMLGLYELSVLARN